MMNAFPMTDCSIYQPKTHRFIHSVISTMFVVGHFHRAVQYKNLPGLKLPAQVSFLLFNLIYYLPLSVNFRQVVSIFLVTQGNFS